jgi:hypothetical protein
MISPAWFDVKVGQGGSIVISVSPSDVRTFVPVLLLLGTDSGSDKIVRSANVKLCNENDESCGTNGMDLPITWGIMTSVIGGLCTGEMGRVGLEFMNPTANSLEIELIESTHVFE